MLETELSEHLGYEACEVKGRNSGNSRNGRYAKKLRTSGGDTTIQVPRDRNGEFEPQVVKKQAANTNELEDKIIGMYAKGMSVRDMQETLRELYGVEVSPTTLSAITDKVWGWVIVFGTAWRIMGNPNFNVQFIRQSLQVFFENIVTRTVASTAA